MWLAEAYASGAHKEFFLKRELVLGLLFSMNQSTMDHLKKFVADTEATEKALKPKAPPVKPDAAAGTSAEQRGFTAFKQAFNKTWGSRGRGRGRSGAARG